MRGWHRRDYHAMGRVIEDCLYRRCDRSVTVCCLIDQGGVYSSTVVDVCHVPFLMFLCNCTGVLFRECMRVNITLGITMNVLQ